MTHREILDAMGSEASDAEAKAMRDILKEKGIESLDQLTEKEFFALIHEAIARATWIEDDSSVIDAIEGAKSDWFAAHAAETLPATDETTDGEINKALGLPWGGALRPLADEFAGWSKDEITEAVKAGLDSWGWLAQA